LTAAASACTETTVTDLRVKKRGAQETEYVKRRKRYLKRGKEGERRREGEKEIREKEVEVEEEVEVVSTCPLGQVQLYVPGPV